MNELQHKLLTMTEPDRHGDVRLLLDGKVVCLHIREDYARRILLAFNSCSKQTDEWLEEFMQETLADNPIDTIVEPDWNPISRTEESD